MIDLNAMNAIIGIEAVGNLNFHFKTIFEKKRKNMLFFVCFFHTGCELNK